MWTNLTELSQLDNIHENSSNKAQLIFKHSTRCSISHLAKNRLEAGMQELCKKFDLFYLDILSYRQISNIIAEKFQEHHESPQVLIISNKLCIMNLTHQEIIVKEILEID